MRRAGALGRRCPTRRKTEWAQKLTEGQQYLYNKTFIPTAAFYGEIAVDILLRA